MKLVAESNSALEWVNSTINIKNIMCDIEKDWDLRECTKKPQNNKIHWMGDKVEILVTSYEIASLAFSSLM